MRDWESPEITMSPGPSIRATIGFVLWVLSGKAFSSCRRHDALEEEIRLLTFKGLKWQSRAVEERKRNQAVRGLVQTIRGMCSDERPHPEIDVKLMELLDLLEPS